jgi:hypothetical protein
MISMGFDGISMGFIVLSTLNDYKSQLSITTMGIPSGKHVKNNGKIHHC